jgi:hypothetical protein
MHKGVDAFLLAGYEVVAEHRNCRTKQRQNEDQSSIEPSWLPHTAAIL